MDMIPYTFEGYGYDYLPDAPDYLNEGNVVFRVSESSYVLDGDGLPEGVTCGLSACIDANGNIVAILMIQPISLTYGPDPGAKMNLLKNLDYSDYDDRLTLIMMILNLLTNLMIVILMILKLIYDDGVILILAAMMTFRCTVVAEIMDKISISLGGTK